MRLARSSSAACVFGKNLFRFSRNVETRQKNIPAFQWYLPEATYSTANGSAGFSVNRLTANTRRPFPGELAEYREPPSVRAHERHPAQPQRSFDILQVARCNDLRGAPRVMHRPAPHDVRESRQGR